MQTTRDTGRNKAGANGLAWVSIKGANKPEPH